MRNEGRHEGDCRYRDINLGIGYAVMHICQLYTPVPNLLIPVGIVKAEWKEHEL